MVWLNLLQNQLESCNIQVTWSIHAWKIPYKISKSGAINTGVLSDHPAINLKCKVTHLWANMHKTVEVRQLKNFNETEFLRDLGMVDWNRVTTHNDPNEMLDIWKHLFTSAIDKYAPLKKKGLETNTLPGLLMNCCVKCMKKIF